MWFKKRRQKRAKKMHLELRLKNAGWSLGPKAKSSFLAQNALAKNASSVKQSLYDPAKNIEQYFKTKKPRSYKSIYLRDNDQKNTLMLSKVHMRVMKYSSKRWSSN